MITDLSPRSARVSYSCGARLIIENKGRPRRRLVAEGGSGDPATGLGEGVEGDGEDDDDSDDDLLDVGGDVHEHETIEENADEDRTDDSAEEGAAPTK